MLIRMGQDMTLQLALALRDHIGQDRRQRRIQGTSPYCFQVSTQPWNRSVEKALPARW
jgi:hypothetical protein